jgi:hypothetical protein
LALILLPEVLDIEPIGKGLHNVPGVFLASIFHHDDFKIPNGLEGETLQELADFIRPVEQGNDDGKSHGPKVGRASEWPHGNSLL